MLKGDGLRPQRGVPKGTPESDVRSWRIDTNPYRRMLSSGKYDIPRRRWDLHNMPRAQALDILRARVGRLRRGEPAILDEKEATVLEEQRRRERGMTVREYAEERYLPYLLKHKERTTWENREKHLRLHVYPVLANVPLREAATPEGVEILYDHLAQVTYERKGERRPLGRDYKNLILLSFSALVSHGSNPQTCRPPACDQQSVTLFPEDVSSIQHGSYEGYTLGTNREKALSLEQVRRLLAATHEIVDPDYPDAQAFYYVMVGLGLYPGCRLAEACARKWSDIDWDQGLIAVDSQIKRNDVEGPTKNRLSGSIELAEPMLAALGRLKEHADGAYILGGRRGPAGSHSGGKPYLSTNNLHDRYAKLTRIAFGAASMKYHALRHRYVTSLVDAGTPVHEVKVLARHKKIATTYLYVAGNTARQRAASRGLSFESPLQVIEGGERKVG